MVIINLVHHRTHAVWVSNSREHNPGIGLLADEIQPFTPIHLLQTWMEHFDQILGFIGIKLQMMFLHNNIISYRQTK